MQCMYLYTDATHPTDSFLLLFSHAYGTRVHLSFEVGRERVIARQQDSPAFVGRQLVLGTPEKRAQLKFDSLHSFPWQA